MRPLAIFALICTAPAFAQHGSSGSTIGGHSASGTGMYRYDRQEPWLHGFYQHVPAYGGHGSFRPYNYKHVLSQASLSQQWGSQPSMPYSHQFYNRYRTDPAAAGPGPFSRASLPKAIVPTGSSMVPIPAPVQPVRLSGRPKTNDSATHSFGGFTMPGKSLPVQPANLRKAAPTVDSKVRPAIQSQVYAPLFPIPGS